MKMHEKLKKLFAEKGRGSQIALARLLDEDKGFISRWVSGKQEVPKSKLKYVANYLGTTVDYLLDDTQEVALNRYIPIIGSASCGVPTEHFYDGDVEYLAVPNDVNPITSYAVVASGDSMFPLLSDGDLIVCDSDIPPEDNSVVHYTFDDTSGIKRIKTQTDGSILLSPENREYSPILIPFERTTELYTSKCTKVIKNI